MYGNLPTAMPGILHKHADAVKSNTFDRSYANYDAHDDNLSMPLIMP